VPPVGRLPRWAAAVAAPAAAVVAIVALLTVSLVPLGAQEQDGSEVRVFRQDGGPEGEVSLVVTTPPAVIGAALPPSAFEVRQGGAPVTAEVSAMTPESLEVVLVLGARSTSSLAAEQQSGAEFLRGLPEGVGVGVVDASGPTTLVPVTRDGDQVGQALLALENAASSDPTSEVAVEAALDEFSGEAIRKVVLLMTDDDGDVSPDLAGRLVEEGVSLYYVQAAVGAQPVDTLVETAAATGGRAQAGDLRGLIRTVDEVGTDLTNQYEVRFESTGDAEAEVQVTTAGGVLTGSVDLAAPPPTVAPRTDEAGASTPTTATSDEGGGGSGGAVVAVVIVLLLLAGAAGGLLLLARRRSTPPPAGPPVLIDQRDAPEPQPQPEGQPQPQEQPGGASSQPGRPNG
jgi:hypothetical protein